MITLNELGQVVNDKGQVAMRSMQQSQVFVQCNNHEYVFTLSGTVTMSFVDPVDVDCLLGVRIGCNCGGGKKQSLFLADERHTRIWLAGGGSGLNY